MLRKIINWLKLFIVDLWRKLAGTDLRSLALFRILLSLTLLINAWMYWPLFHVFFTDSVGFFLPEDAKMAQSNYYWSILYLSNHQIFLYCFFGAYVINAFLLLVGYRTRLMTIIAWILNVSLKNRAIIFLTLADAQLVIMLFWAMFLPLGARFSVDAALNKRKTSSNTYVGIACLAFMLNVTYVYFMGALKKNHPIWNENFDAIYYSLNMVEWTTPLAEYLLMLGDYLKPLTASVYYLELFSPLLFFLPWGTSIGRLMAVALLISMHLGIAFFLGIGIFPWISCAALCVFLPTIFWKPIANWWQARKQRLNITIFYDQDCTFCKKMSLILCELAILPKENILPAQQNELVNSIFKNQNTWVVRSHCGRYLTHWNAFSYLCRRSPVLFPIGYLFILPVFSQLGNLFYKLIAQSRKYLGSISSYFLSFTDKPLYRPGKITQFIITTFILLVLAENLLNTNLINIPWHNNIDHSLRLVSLKQNWNMYSPYPRRQSNWWVIEGTLHNGSKVDLLNNIAVPPKFGRPASSWEMLPNAHWSKFFSKISWLKKGRYLTNYYCGRWNKKYPTLRLRYLRGIRFQQSTLPPGELRPEPVQKLLLQRKCPTPN